MPLPKDAASIEDLPFEALSDEIPSTSRETIVSPSAEPEDPEIVS